MQRPKLGNPLAWGLVLSIVTSGLVLFQQFLPATHQPFPDPAASIGSAFAFGAIVCYVVDAIRQWLWEMTNSPRRR